MGCKLTFFEAGVPVSACAVAGTKCGRNLTVVARGLSWTGGLRLLPLESGARGATTIGPDATHPPAICQKMRGGGGILFDLRADLGAHRPPGGRTMASRGLCISDGHACDARPVRLRRLGVGGRPHRCAPGWEGEGWGSLLLSTMTARGGGDWQLGRGGGGRGGKGGCVQPTTATCIPQGGVWGHGGVEVCKGRKSSGS